MYLSRQKSKWLLALTVATSSVALALPAYAHDAESVRSHAQGHHKWPQATLQAEAVAEISQDTVRITLATEVSEASQSAVAQALGKTLEEVMKQSKDKAGDNAKVKVTSGDYRVWPMNDQDGKITNWRGRGEIIVESTDFAAASDIASLFSDRMPIANLAFSVSPKVRAQKEEALLEQAAKAFRDRAQALAEAFGYASYDIKEIDLGGAGARYESAAPRVMAMAGSQAKVPLEAGTEQVTVSVRGSIFLHPEKK